MAQGGYGSPFPLLYHRLQVSLAAAVALSGLGPLAALKVCVLLALAAGGAGMHRLAREAGATPTVAVSAGLLLVFSNYSYTDWLVRGAFAEHLAFMLVPWLLLAGLAFSRRTRGSAVTLGVTFALLFHAHSVLALFALPVMGLAVWRRLSGRLGRRSLPADLRAILLAGGVSTTLAGPFALAVALEAPSFRVGELRTGPFDVARNYPEAWALVADSYRFGEGSTGLSDEVGRRFFPASLGLILAATVLGLSRRIPRERLADQEDAALMVGLGLGLYGFLLAPASLPFYRAFSPAGFLQFPSRLLAFVTPLAILGLVLSVGVLFPARGHPIGVAGRLLLPILAAWQVAWGVSIPASTPRFSPLEVVRAASAEGQSRSHWFGAEFLPRGIDRPAPRPPFEVLKGRVFSCRPPAALAVPAEWREIRLGVEAAPGCEVVFNQFAGPFFEVDPGEGGTLSRTAWGTFLVRPSPGKRLLTFRRRRFGSLLVALVRRGPRFGEPLPEETLAEFPVPPGIAVEAIAARSEQRDAYRGLAVERGLDRDLEAQAGTPSPGFPFVRHFRNPGPKPREGLELLRGLGGDPCPERSLHSVLRPAAAVSRPRL